MIAAHSFVIYELAIAAAGATARVVPLRKDYSFDLAAMTAIDENTRVIFLGNPNNPTGTIYRRAEWKRFLQRVPQRVVIVADEAYFEFVRDPEYPDSLEDHDGMRFLITMRTFSKIFGLAGLRVAYVVTRPDIVRLLDDVRAVQRQFARPGGGDRRPGRPRARPPHARQQSRWDGVPGTRA